MSQPKQRQIAILKINEWFKQARPKQITPPSLDWNIWLILAGRGFGKTRLAAEDVTAYALSNENKIIGVIAPTSDNLRKVCFEGESGILSTLPKECIIQYNKTLHQIILFNGSQIDGYSAEKPARLRGAQFHRCWWDEPATCQYQDEVFAQIDFCNRLGENPQLIMTTTPKPTKLIKDLFERRGKDVFLTSGSTFENEENIARSTLEAWKIKYEGTRIGKQELYAEILTDIPGALWSYKIIEDNRVKKCPEFIRIVIAVDPAVTHGEDSDSTGIIVVGKGIDGYAYVINDLTCKLSPNDWGQVVVNAYDKYQADKIVVEVNQGGDLVETVLKTIDNNVAINKVRASKGKITRAEPIAALYEQNKVKHFGVFAELENEMCGYVPDRLQKSPDRMDALVYGVTELILDYKETFVLW